MELIPRVQGILLKPKVEWEKIKGEKTTIAQLYTSYVIFLAAIPAIAQFIGYGIVGIRIPFVGWYRFGLVNSLVRSVVYYALTLAAVYVVALVINALANSFGSKPNMENAFKLAVYTMTPSWVAGALYIIPALAILVLLAAIYGAYILYLGLSAGIMETPKDKVAPYTGVIIVVAFVVMLVIGLILGAIFSVGVGLRAI